MRPARATYTSVGATKPHMAGKIHTDIEDLLQIK